MCENIFLNTAKEILNANKILFITGAGISADSGMPTYRGIGGLYDNRNTDDGIPIEEALSGNMLNRKPGVCWKYLWQIGEACAKVKPNNAHKIITKIQEIKSDTWVLTQNVDNLHKLAGNINLIEIHGNAFELFCTKCKTPVDAKSLISNYKKNITLPPLCKKCKGLIRPRVVLFGEMLPEKALIEYYNLLNSNLDLIISIGTSSLFPYIVQPVINAANQGIPTIEINP